MYSTCIYNVAMPKLIANFEASVQPRDTWSSWKNEMALEVCVLFLLHFYGTETAHTMRYSNDFLMHVHVHVCTMYICTVCVYIHVYMYIYM